MHLRVFYAIKLTYLLAVFAKLIDTRHEKCARNTRVVAEIYSMTNVCIEFD